MFNNIKNNLTKGLESNKFFHIICERGHKIEIHQNTGSNH